jgi:hypothetical protein
MYTLSFLLHKIKNCAQILKFELLIEKIKTNRTSHYFIDAILRSIFHGFGESNIAVIDGLFVVGSDPSEVRRVASKLCILLKEIKAVEEEGL